MRGWALWILLAASVSVSGAQNLNDDVTTSFRVRYVGAGSVYVGGGRSAGLAEGMKLVVKRQQDGAPVPTDKADDSDEPGIVAHLKVVAIAETSAVCEVVSSKRTLVVGDLATLEREDVEKLVQRRILSNTREYPAVVTFTEGDPLDEELRNRVPRPPLPEINRAVGRIGFDYSGLSSPGQRSSLVGLVLRSDITRIGGTYWNLNGYWRGTLDTRSSTLQPTLQQLLNRTYHLSLTYANPNSKWVAGLGRLLLPYASSLETIDGGYFGRRLSKTATAGLFGGTTPDPTSWRYSPDRRLAGTFLNFSGGSYDRVKYDTSFGAGVSTLLWQIDRPFAFAETTVSYEKVLSIYDAVQVDRPRINDPTAPPVGVGVGRNYFSLRIQPYPRLAFDLNQNYFRDVPAFDPQLVGTGLLDKYLFQGLSGGVRAEVLRHLTVYSNIGRNNSNRDSRSSWNSMLGVSKSEIWKTHLTADVRYSRFSSVFAQGTYQTLSVSRNFGEGLRLEMQAGRQKFVSAFTNDTGSHFVTANVDCAVRSHYFLEGGLTVERGTLQNYSQWHMGFGYRFDNRRAKPGAFNAAQP